MSSYQIPLASGSRLLLQVSMMADLLVAEVSDIRGNALQDFGNGMPRIREGLQCKENGIGIGV